VSRSQLAGPEGHPFHPMLVTLPVGAFVSSLVFDILTWTRPGELPWLVDGAFWLIEVGLIGVVIAAPFGWLDYRTIPPRTPASTLARAHIALNATAVALFAVGLAWRAGDHVELDKTRSGQLALNAVAVSLLIIAMWLGNTLTYRHRTRVVKGADDRDGAIHLR
jgi:uncharacterized membrane protein